MDTNNPEYLSADVEPVIPEFIWSEFEPIIKKIISEEYIRVSSSVGKKKYFGNDNLIWTASALELTQNISDNKEHIRQAARPSWIRENVTGLMIVTAIMAVTFGVLGVMGMSLDGQAKDATQGFLDIAKLFAGALIGAAGAVSVGAVVKK